ncbi:RNA polymerase sigma-70 factor, ECF subfamily [Parapedobacter luteus]|uniref:RNA polymerase sigma-70 factor, ECF subfamily n=1 Tax=Parapedobacter luteus TaxID=623280 RepID=A0A1T5A200_9SPHI|nr:RNA polymerase sigma factor [Parapedobacter luteus]SKB28663.1 RNA polymerase sigma-70 factor, ECF subfamily [Parapedobacter luteus]
MGTYEFGFKQTGQLLYVDGKEDGLLADILSGRLNLTAQLEEQVYRRYWGKLMGVARRYVVDTETAREVVNDSFVKAFDRLADFRGQGPDKPAVFSAWLIRITVNTAIDRLRGQRTMPEPIAVDRLESHPAVEMDDRLQLDDILRLLEGLPDIQRIVFNLYELEGYKHNEIAELLQIPASSSRVYLTKAKQELRSLYIKYFGGRYDG